MPVRRQFNTAPPTSWQPPSGGEQIELKIKVVTPMFGGGYEAGVVDDIVPIRVAAIRGHLRFWWRATAGAKYGNAKDLYEAEEALWGGAAHEEPKGTGKMAGAGRIKVSVQCESLDRRDLVRLDKANGVPDYSRAILIQESTKTEKDIRERAQNVANWRDFIRGEEQRLAGQIEAEKNELYPWIWAKAIEFGLTLSDSKSRVLSEEVLLALRAFIQYGSVGARGRRGFGCLALEDWTRLPSVAKEPSLEGGEWTRGPGCTSAADAVLFWGAESGPPKDMWRAAIEILHRFRKAEMPTNPRRRPSGTGSHTTWPEADMIRRLKNPPVRVLHTGHGAAHRPKPCFPRAALGLPLEFRSQKSHAGAFGKASLSLKVGGNDRERLASPVIAKPVWRNGAWHPGILILNQGSIASMLQVTSDPAAMLTTDCSGEPLGLWNGTSNVAFGGSATTVLDALKHYLKTHAKWTEVTTL